MEKGIMQHLTAAAELSDEVLPGIPLIEIAGESRVLIEHHFGVTEYGRCQICVRVKYGLVIIHGSHLELTRMTRQIMVVTGCIECVRLERRR
jgi:sporulation protein YqfC